MNTYPIAYIFTKKGNLIPYYDAKEKRENERLYRYYEGERELQLILLVRFDVAGNRERTMCRIKCPVNPLPIKGEFEVVSVSLMIEFLTNLGWKWKEKLYQSMFEA